MTEFQTELTLLDIITRIPGQFWKLTDFFILELCLPPRYLTSFLKETTEMFCITVYIPFMFK